MNMKKKILILVLIIILIGILILFFISGFKKRTDVVLNSYTVSEDGTKIKLNIEVTSSIGYTRNLKVKQGGDNKYITFYSTFGTVNSNIGAKSEYEIELNPSCSEIYFYVGDGGYELVLKKNEKTNKWEQVKYNNENNKEKINWEEITENGVNEELLFENVDIEILKQIAMELQTLVSQEVQDERENPEIVILEGWTRVFKSEKYKKVLDIGEPAMKPLYLILYKSPNSGMYEYICAKALYELSGFDFEWTNSINFLEKFNEQIIKNNKSN